MLSDFLTKWLDWQWVNMSEVSGMLQQLLNQISTDNQLILGKVAVKCQWSVSEVSKKVEVEWQQILFTLNNKKVAKAH